jgi:hypothetical protein
MLSPLAADGVVQNQEEGRKVAAVEYIHGRTPEPLAFPPSPGQIFAATANGKKTLSSSRLSDAAYVRQHYLTRIGEILIGHGTHLRSTRRSLHWRA